MTGEGDEFYDSSVHASTRDSIKREKKRIHKEDNIESYRKVFSFDSFKKLYDGFYQLQTNFHLQTLEFDQLKNKHRTLSYEFQLYKNNNDRRIAALEANFGGLQ